SARPSALVRSTSTSATCRWAARRPCSDGSWSGSGKSGRSGLKRPDPLQRPDSQVSVADGGREADLHLGAGTWCARHPDVPAALLDDAVDRGESEPGAFAERLGREERLECP